MTVLTGGASAGIRPFARVCSKVGSADVKAAAPPVELVDNSNSKGGDAGIYVFGVEGMRDIYRNKAMSKSVSFNRSICINIHYHLKVQVGNDQEKGQSERNPHCKNRGGKN